MPINPIVLQRRHAELGRIRLGDTVETQKRGGGTFQRPRKLSTFRFTSGNREHIQALADLYGGEPKAWDNAGKAEWDVTTDAKSIPVLVVKGGMSQWLETWEGGGCVHRCDGVTNDLTKEPCDPDDPAHLDAKPTTRLSVMLSDLESLGVWRMESHGWNAAAELPSMAELAQIVADLVPARLHLVERTSKGRDGGKVVTRQFVVPVLDLEVSKARLLSIVGGGAAAPQIGAQNETRQIGAGPADPWEQGAPDYGSRAIAATTVEECTAIWHEAGAAGELTHELQAVIKGRVSEIQAANPHPAGPPTEAGEDIVEGSVDVDPAVDAAWQALVLEAGKRGVGDTDLRAMLEQEYAQPVDDLTADQLQAQVDHMRTLPVPS